MPWLGFLKYASELSELKEKYIGLFATTFATAICFGEYPEELPYPCNYSHMGL